MIKLDEGPVAIYVWKEDGQTRYGSILPGPTPGLRRTVMAGTKDGLLRAIDIAAGKGESLDAKAEGALAHVPRSGSIVFAAATGLKRLRGAGHERAMVTQKAESFFLDAGESENELYADAVVTAKTAEDAGLMVQMLQGGLAMAQMWSQGNPDMACLGQFARGLKFSTNGTEVVVEARYSSQTVGAAMKSLEAQLKRWQDAEKGDKKDKDEDPE